MYTKNHISAVRPLKSLDRAYPAVTMTNILKNVPISVRATEMAMERMKFAFWNVFS